MPAIIPHGSRTNYKESQGVIANLTLGAALRTAGIGLCPWGPVAGETIDEVKKKFVEVASWPEFKRQMGNFEATHPFPKAAWAYFKVGGQILYVSRTVHFTDPADASSATSARATGTVQSTQATQTFGTVESSNSAPYALAAGDQLDFKVDGGGTDPALFDAAAATLECGTAETYDLSTGGETLLIKIDQGAVQTITFQTAMFGTPTLATALEVAAAMNAQLDKAKVYTSTADTKVTIDSDKEGLGSYVEVTGGTANSGILDFSTSEVQGTSTAGIQDIEVVTIAEVKAWVESEVTDTLVTDDGDNTFSVSTTTPGSGGSIQVEASSTADQKFGLDNSIHTGVDSGAVDSLKVDGKFYGARGNTFTYDIAAATNGDANFYDLVVYEGGVFEERHYNLDYNNVEDEVNEISDLIRATTLGDHNPDATTGETISGGSDGLTSLDDNDYAGDQAAGTGFRSFDSLKVFRLALTDRETVPHVKSFQTYLGTTRKALAILLYDIPTGNTYVQARTYMTSTGPKGFSEFGATYWPYAKWPNPDRNVLGTGDEVEFPSSAAVAGRTVYTSSQRDAGFADEAANKGLGTFLEATDVADDDVNKEWVRDLLYPDLINPVRAEDGQVYNDGVLVNKVDGNFPTVAQRLTACETAQRVLQFLDAMRHKGLSEDGYKERFSGIETILETLADAGAYASRVYSTAFYIDDSGNTPAMARLLRYKVKIGIATIDPGEFNDFELGYNERGLFVTGSVTV